MPSINRIRINNVRYNDGKDYYDDMIISACDDNVYIDMFNGGGKSLFMQLTLQTILPNSKLQDEWEFKKLFSKSNNNKIIHVMTEWTLDEGSDYKYMITGFCASKSQSKGIDNDNEEEEEKLYAPDYFNYICLYNEPNQNDIAQFPLNKKAEPGKIPTRLTAAELKAHLRSIKGMGYYVEICDTTTSYHDRLVQYNINPEEWELIKEVNVDEKYTSTYFRKNYKNSRDFILKFLIPIVEKCYASQISGDYQDKDSLADSLINIKEQLTDLIKKKEQIEDYDYLYEVIKDLSSILKEIYDCKKKKEESYYNIGTGINYLERENNKLKIDIEDLDKVISELERNREILQREKRASHIYLEKKVLEEKAKEVSKLLAEKEEAFETKEKLIKTLKYKKAQNSYYQYLSAESKLEKEKLILANSEKDNEELSKERKILGSKIKNYANNLYSSLLDKINNTQESNKEINNKLKELTSNKNKNEANKEYCLRSISKNKEKTDRIINQQKSENYNLINELEKNQQVLEKLEYDKSSLEDEIIKCERLIKDKNFDINNRKEEIVRYKEKISILKTKLENKHSNFKIITQKIDEVKEISDIFGIADFIELKDYIESLKKIKSVEIAGRKLKIDSIKEHIESLKNNTISLTQDTFTVFDILKEKFKNVILGRDFINSCSLEDKERYLNLNSLLPYGIAMTNKDFEGLKSNPEVFNSYNGSAVPIINMDKIEEGSIFTPNTIFSVKDASFFLDEERIKNEREEQEILLSIEEDEFETLTEEFNDLESSFSVVASFLALYPVDIKEDMETEIGELEGDLIENQDLIESVSNVVEQINNEIKALEDNNDELKELLKTKTTSIVLLADYLKLQEEYSNLQNENLQMEEQIKVLEDLISSISKEIKNNENLIKENNEKVDKFKDIRRDLKVELDSYNTIEIIENEIIISEDEYNSLLPEFNALNELYKNKIKDIGDISSRISEYKIAMENHKVNIAGEGHSIYDFEDTNLNNFIPYNIEEIQKANDEIEEWSDILSYVTTSYDKAKELYDKESGKVENMMKDFNDRAKNIDDIYENIIIEVLEKFKNKTIETIISEYNSSIKVTSNAINSKVLSKDELGKKHEKNVVTIRKFSDELMKDGIDIKNYKEAIKPEISLNNILNELNISKNSLVRSMKKYELRINDIEVKLNNSHIHAFKTILNDLRVIPESSEDIKIIIRKLIGDESITNEMSMLNLIINSKQKILDDIETLEKQEENFITLCVQKCINVYRDVKKLQALSRIDFNGRKQDMLEINLKMLNEEDCYEKMKNYIEHIISIDYSNISDSDRRSEIARSLSMERLFPQILEGIKADSVKVYKVEDIYDESKNRFKKWHEAIGSKGQTNAMYICVLICVMSYIRHLKSPAASDGKKFLMLDNPFAGTVTESLWVGIINLLKENNFQFMAVGFETKPTLVNNFATKYYLNKQNLGRMESTVVIDFKSNYNLHNLDYDAFVGKKMMEQMQIDLFQ